MRISSTGGRSEGIEVSINEFDNDLAKECLNLSEVKDLMSGSKNDAVFNVVRLGLLVKTFN